MKKLFLKLAVIILFIPTMPVQQAFAAVPGNIIYEGRLLDSSDSPITTAHTFRFSFWSSNDRIVSDIDGAGAINGAAVAYGGWQEVQTVTPNTNGTFSIKLGSITALPTIDFTSHKFLQIEIKVSGADNTAYQVMDPTGDDGVDGTDRNTIGSVPYTNNADYSSGSNEEIFILDKDNTISGAGTGSIQLKFGNTLSKLISYDTDNNYFNFNDSVNIQGNLTITGTLNSENVSDIHSQNTDTGSNQNTFILNNDANDATLQFGQNLDGQIVYNDTNNTFDFDANKIINLVNPTGDQDAATKNYVDTFINGLSWRNPIEHGNQLVAGGAGVGGIRGGGRIDVDNETQVNANDTLTISYNSAASSFVLTAKDAPTAASCEFKSGTAASGNTDMASSILSAINACASASDFAGQSTSSGATAYVIHDSAGTVGNGTITASGSGFIDADMHEGTAFASIIANETRLTESNEITYTWDASDNQWIQITGAGSIPDATTISKGKVELAADGESIAGVVVQGNDSRLHTQNTDTGSSQDRFIINNNGNDATLQFGQNLDGQIVYNDTNNTFDFDANKIINLVNPTGDQDAATKNYVDGLVNGLNWRNPIEHGNQLVAGGAGVGGIRSGGRIDVDNETQVNANDTLTISYNSAASSFVLTAKDAPTAASCEFKSGTAASGNTDMASSILSAINACASASDFAGQSTSSGATAYVIHDSAGTVGNGTITASGSGFIDADMHEGTAFAGIVSDETRLNNASGATFMWDDANNEWIQISGANTVADATTTSKGKVELATDGESVAGVVVQGNDSRLHTQNTDTGSANNTYTLDSDDTGGNVDLIFGTTVAQYLRHDGTLFHFSDDLRMDGATKIEFRDGALAINSSADGQLDIDADTEVEITTTTLDLNGTLDATGMTSTGTVNFSGAGALRIRENANPATNSACTTVGELILDTTDSEIQVCTGIGISGSATWVAVDASDADTLDTLNSLQLLRSDTSDSFTSGTLTLANGTTLTVNGIVNLGDNGDTVAIDSSDWDISTTGVITGVSIDADGAGNSITNIENADIKAGANIVFSKLAARTKKLFINMDDMTVILDGTANKADLYTDSETGANPHQFYILRTKQTALQDMDIKIKVKLPEDFVDFTTAASDLSFFYKNTGINATDSKIDILVEDDDGDDAFTAGDGQGLFNTGWTEHTDEFDGGLFNPAAGEYIYITIKGYASKDGSTEQSPYMGEIVLTYTGR